MIAKYYFGIPPICNISSISTIFSLGLPCFIPLSTSTLSIFVHPFQSTVIMPKKKFVFFY